MDIINYYASGSTANGYVSMLENNLQGIEKVFFIKGEADFISLYEKIISLWQQEENNIEYIYSPFHTKAYEGIINRSINTAVIFDIHPNMQQNLKNINGIEIIDFGEAIGKSRKSVFNDLINNYNTSIEKCLDNAYFYFNKALKVHDEWEKIYIENMDFQKADNLASKLINKIVSGELEKKAKELHRFLGAATPEGAKDFILNLTEDMTKRYFIKGRPGTGKSTILKKIAKVALGKGFDTEIYHCGFDSNSLDMVIIREKGICIFDSTLPHEHFPNRESDEIVDVYLEAVKYGTDEKYADEISDIVLRYRSNIKIATSYLDTMKTIESCKTDYYKKIADQNIYNDLTWNFLQKL